MKSTTNPTTPFRWLPLFLLAFVTLTLASCDNGAEKRQKDLDDFNAYVKNQKDSIDLYADRKWDDLQVSYEAKKAELAKDTAKMSQEMRTSYYQTESDWENYKAEFARKAEENKALSGMDALRKTLAPEGVRTDFTDVTAANIVSTYNHFVATVDQNKEAYSKEQWTVVNVSWKALKGRKREIAKDIKGDDMGKITKKEIEYAGIKAVNRPFAADEEDLPKK